ncbi:MAG TPA: hypothetical protein VK427_24365, partial [Kofleriaceae bacterium]|nr:hypothetical protein [Kofleriaceae bacterium]
MAGHAPLELIANGGDMTDGTMMDVPLTIDLFIDRADKWFADVEVSRAAPTNHCRGRPIARSRSARGGSRVRSWARGS